MASNALLCRWLGGWHERIAAAAIALHGRREALLGIGATQSVGEVETIADSQLRIFGNTRNQFTTTIETRDKANMPYWSANIGDLVTVPDDQLVPVDVRMMSITISEDAEGNPIFTPQYNDLIFQENERTSNSMKKMTNGTLGGNSTIATPAAFIPVPSPNCCPPPPPPPPTGGGG